MIEVISPTAARRRLLSGSSDERVGLAEHRSHYQPPAAATEKSQRELIELVARAGLRGRGGAGFPTARKLQAVADRRGPRVVVANGTEGEPASKKDKTLLMQQPHLVLDGALWAAHVVGTTRVVLALERGRPEVLRSLRLALAERSSAPAEVPVELVETPPRYVAGEESALVHWLNGGPAKPTATPPRPSEHGVDGRPTLVQNVETLAHLALIAAHGGDWFRGAGEPEEPGTMLVTVSGLRSRPRVLEADVGTPIVHVLERAEVDPSELGALLVGGFFGTWLSPSSAGLPLSRHALASHGASPGAGVLIALPRTACGLEETARILTWYATESAGQCGACVFGLADVARAAGQLAAGTLAPSGLKRLERWASEIAGRGACHHPNGATRLLGSALQIFAEDVERHLANAPCRAPQALAIPASRAVWR
jgi:NADH:ubiquinone oxidoreductase subunit F (NADH-binding)